MVTTKRWMDLAEGGASPGVNGIMLREETARVTVGNGPARAFLPRVLVMIFGRR